ncbi:beta-galactosidase [Vibrio mangrovi]|uniref:Beta-galactosidase n=1 Tax=Vibrio mangrovi TaxID=474394 RepID=A0A1Y6ITJ9_9VIBR|nr:beta-galactosidase [Vibrio mangrovi]MDW6004694.1 beta-galactosidase [Vibrio mangrovi]SMS00985.1 Beta-galactosidase BglY [Vibrio mangrovi]
MQDFSPILPKVNRLLHGADYNPEQWLDRPDILERDIELMKATHCNVMSVGIFSWTSLEPREGEFRFEWLDAVLDRLAEHDISVFLATPSGARPAWLSQQYPSVLRVNSARVKQLHGERHNHCYTSPEYREKVAIINARLAERYSDHPAVIGWHISNEYGGDCHCEHCQSAFRHWLQEKYQDLDELNSRWWSKFWSHTYSDWSQIESPSPVGENSVHGLKLDWKRFVTSQVTDFCLHEIQPLKAENPDLPVIANLMEYFYDYDYWKLSQVLDIVSWDSYPLWHKGEDDLALACYTAMYHDLMRSLKNKPFLLMESTPSQTNWQPVTKLKKPGMHLLASMQAVAHGSDSVQYFQWRKSRGSVEKFHGAVVDHVGHVDTRVGREVTQVGHLLSQIPEVAGSRTSAEVAIIFDWESRWAMDDAQGPRNAGLFYEQTVTENYRGFWEQGIACDVIEQLCDFSPYKVVVAPMLYLIKPGVAERIEQFVQQGGIFVATYWSGIVDEDDLCFLGGFPGGENSPLRRTLGIWAEEIDSLYDEEQVAVIAAEQNPLQLEGEYQARHLCELVHLEGAQALAHYGSDFFSGMPAVTRHSYGKGYAYYVTSRNDLRFQQDFYRGIVRYHDVKPVIPVQLPQGVSVTKRVNADQEFFFVMNFNATPVTFTLDHFDYFDVSCADLLADKQLHLDKYEIKVLKR